MSPLRRAADIGVLIAPRFWRRGLGYHATAGLLRFAFDHLGLHRIGAVIMDRNTPSVGLFQKLGFEREGLMRDYSVYANGSRVDAHLYARLRSDRTALPEAEIDTSL